MSNSEYPYTRKAAQQQERHPNAIFQKGFEGQQVDGHGDGLILQSWWLVCGQEMLPNTNYFHEETRVVRQRGTHKSGRDGIVIRR